MECFSPRKQQFLCTSKAETILQSGIEATPLAYDLPRGEIPHHSLFMGKERQTRPIGTYGRSRIVGVDSSWSIEDEELTARVAVPDSQLPSL